MGASLLIDAGLLMCTFAVLAVLGTRRFGGVNALSALLTGGVFDVETSLVFVLVIAAAAFRLRRAFAVKAEIM